MTRDDTQPDAKRHARLIDTKLKYNAVCNRRKERVRGLWERNGVFYAQVKVRGWIGRVPLHNCETVPDAQAARQALKAEIKAGTWKTPKERGQDLQKVGTEVGMGGAHGEAYPEEKRVLHMAIQRYKQSRDLLGKKDPKTGKREDSGLKQWAAFKSQLPIAPESFDQKLLLDFAEWRKEVAKTKGRAIAGRSVDVNVTSLANVVRWCVVQKWLPELPSSGTGMHWPKSRMNASC